MLNWSLNLFIFSNLLIYIFKKLRVFFIAITFLNLHEFHFAMPETEIKSVVFKCNALVFVASVHKTFYLPIKFLILSKIKLPIIKIYKNSQNGSGMLFPDFLFSLLSAMNANKDILCLSYVFLKNIYD